MYIFVLLFALNLILDTIIRSNLKCDIRRCTGRLLYSCICLTIEKKKKKITLECSEVFICMQANNWFWMLLLSKQGTDIKRKGEIALGYILSTYNNAFPSLVWYLWSVFSNSHLDGFYSNFILRVPPPLILWCCCLKCVAQNRSVWMVQVSIYGEISLLFQGSRYKKYQCVKRIDMPDFNWHLITLLDRSFLDPGVAANRKLE